MLDDDDIPWADPAIRASYEAALGRLILAHNEVDFRLGSLLLHALSELEIETPEKSVNGSFSQRVHLLPILAKALPKSPLKDVDADGLRNLNGERNVLAHGHFDQNPFDGSYDIIGQRSFGKLSAAKRQAYPVERIDELTEQLEKVARQLHGAELWFMFDDLTEDDQTSSTSRP